MSILFYETRKLFKQTLFGIYCRVKVLESSDRLTKIRRITKALIQNLRVRENINLFLKNAVVW
jgi:hypothetical protein